MRRFSRTLRQLEVLGFLLVGIGICGMVWLSAASAGAGSGSVQPLYMTSAPAPPVNASLVRSASGNLRFFYQYSVIPGGVQTADELREAIAGDPVIANHYADFGLRNVSFVTLGRDQAFYVAYRLNSGVYWTSRPMLLHRGEKLITDGFNLARVRCGNRLAEVPMLPVNPSQPAPEEMNVAEVERAPQGVMQKAFYFHKPVPLIPIVPFFILPGGGSPVFFSMAPLPEANWIVTLLMCALVLLLRFALRRRFSVPATR